MEGQNKLDPVSFARGVADGMRDVGTQDRKTANAIRAKTLLETIEHTHDLDDETIGELVKEVYYRYYQSNSGAFFMAEYLKAARAGRLCKSSHPNRLQAALVWLANQMCENLRTVQGGNQAKSSLDIALWVYGEIKTVDGVASSRLMRACGEGLSGKAIDQFFWSIKKSAETDVNQRFTARTFAQGMLSRNAVQILADHLVAEGRGPKLAEEAAKEQG